MLPIARLLSRFGCSGGFVQVELWGKDGESATASLGGDREGQRMAALPAAFVAEALLRKTVSARGTVTAWKALGVRPLLDRLAAAGYVLDVFTSPSM